MKRADSCVLQEGGDILSTVACIRPEGRLGTP